MSRGKGSKVSEPSDLLTVAEAMELLGITTEANLWELVLEKDLRCGVWARSWNGRAYPNLGGRTSWRQGVARSDPDEQGRQLWRLIGVDMDTREEKGAFDIRDTSIGYFWYLDHTSAYNILLGLSYDALFLDPEDGRRLHKANPEAFPTEDFRFWTKGEPPPVSKDDVLFRRHDVEKWARKSDATNVDGVFDSHEEATYLHIIGALISVIIDEESGKEEPPSFKSEAALIRYIAPLYRGYKGVSKRSLESVFRDAKRQLADIS